MSARQRPYWPWVLTIAVVATFAVMRWQTKVAETAPIDSDLVVTAKRENLVLDVLETGRIEARTKIELKSKVAGQVTQVLAEEGARVKKGELLLTLDPTDFQRDMERAEAELTQVKIDIDYSKTVLERATSGAEMSVVPQAEFDKAKHDYAAKDVTVKLAQITLAAAQQRLRDTKIGSPIDGTVVERNIEPGEVVTPGVESTCDGKPLLTVADLSSLIVKVDLNQIDVVKVRIGTTATLTIEALPGKTYEAKVSKIAPASVRLPGREVDLFPIELELSSVDGLLKPGMTADVRLFIEEKPGVISLPVEAFVRKNGKAFVTRVLSAPDGQVATEKIEVTTGARNERAVEVLSGIEEGHRILLTPASAAPGAQL
ncbi:efflux RND transporter periplasmic adaptor subunit [Hyalangium versicolor]|uniref:efflux RND transporter periplasmic adaptor subunit n=1 Tax=Hyalangium versicolor TaxID=2861190 RepID=UPI001CC900CE|nr:efflux RND transporter periplasmic adaptor subunit [Hyalangium versicolor]